MYLQQTTVFVKPDVANHTMSESGASLLVLLKQKIYTSKVGPRIVH